MRPRLKSEKDPGLHLKEWRQWADLTQDELAERMKVSKAVISRRESGERDADLSFLIEAARALNVADYRMLLWPPPGEGAAPPWEVWQRLAEQDRLAVSKVIEALAQKDEGKDGPPRPRRRRGRPDRAQALLPPRH